MATAYSATTFHWNSSLNETENSLMSPDARNAVYGCDASVSSRDSLLSTECQVYLTSTVLLNGRPLRVPVQRVHWSARGLWGVRGG